ncbi:MAG: hypothetical protein IPO32_12920 [Crocinitomicaceae bacterium]|nr:hypothetical protein [Crocinitomicaceae bacterium]
MKNQNLLIAALTIVTFACEKDNVKESVESEKSSDVSTEVVDIETMTNKSVESGPYAYVTSIGTVEEIATLDDTIRVENEIRLMTPEEIAYLKANKLKYQSASCTTSDGKRGLKCVSQKKGDCKAAMNCIQAADGGDY